MGWLLIVNVALAFMTLAALTTGHLFSDGQAAIGTVLVIAHLMVVLYVARSVYRDRIR